MALRIFLRLTMVLIATSSPVFGLTTNPIDPSLPLSTHARATCTNGSYIDPGNIDLITLDSLDGTVQRSCVGGAVHSNDTTLTSVISEGSAAADLRDGTLGARAVGRAYSDAHTSIAMGSWEESYLYDTLTVDGTWTGVRNVELRLIVDGNLTSNAATPNWQIGNQAVSSRLILLTTTGNLLANTGISITQGNNGIPFINTTAEFNGATVTTNAVNQVFDPAHVQFTMTYVFPATTSNRTFSFLGRLSVGSAMGFGTGLELAQGDVNFGNTARFSLTAPADVSVRSESGVFLPEPAPYSLSLLAPALMVLVAGSRVRDRRAA